MFLGKNVSPTFYNRLIALFKEAYLDCWKNEYNFAGTDEELGYYAHFYLSGSLAIVGKWADENFEQSVEQLTIMFADIDNNFREFIGSRFS